MLFGLLHTRGEQTTPARGPREFDGASRQSPLWALVRSSIVCCLSASPCLCSYYRYAHTNTRAASFNGYREYKSGSGILSISVNATDMYCTRLQIALRLGLLIGTVRGTTFQFQVDIGCPLNDDTRSKTSHLTLLADSAITCCRMMAIFRQLTATSHSI